MIVGSLNPFPGLGRVIHKIIKPFRASEKCLNIFNIHIFNRKNISIKKSPSVRQFIAVTVHQSSTGPGRIFPQFLPNTIIRVEKRISRPPWILAWMRTDIGRHTIHLHISNCPFNRLIFCWNLLYIQFVSSKKFLDSIFSAIIESVSLFELCDTCHDLITPSSQHKMNMI